MSARSENRIVLRAQLLPPRRFERISNQNAEFLTRQSLKLSYGPWVRVVLLVRKIIFQTHQDSAKDIRDR